MAPGWLAAVAWLSLSICFCSAGVIACDIAFNHRRQPMGVMNFVFPITALYLGPFALALYLRWGRAAARTATAPMPMSQVAASRVAGAAGGDGRQMHGGQHTHQEMAGAAGPEGTGEPAPPGE